MRVFRHPDGSSGSFCGRRPECSFPLGRPFHCEQVHASKYKRSQATSSPTRCAVSYFSMESNISFRRPIPAEINILVVEAAIRATCTPERPSIDIDKPRPHPSHAHNRHIATSSKNCGWTGGLLSQRSHRLTSYGSLSGGLSSLLLEMPYVPHWKINSGNPSKPPKEDSSAPFSAPRTLADSARVSMDTDGSSPLTRPDAFPQPGPTRMSARSSARGYPITLVSFLLFLSLM